MRLTFRTKSGQLEKMDSELKQNNETKLIQEGETDDQLREQIIEDLIETLKTFLLLF